MRIAGWVHLIVISGAALVAMACGARTSFDGESAGAGPPAPACKDPEPIRQKDTELESGFVRCADGFVHRDAPVTCAFPATPGLCDQTGGACVTDADCTERPHGACQNRLPGDAGKGCNCRYGCASDADCSPGEGCACPGVVGSASRCIPAACLTTAGCGAGLCGLSVRRGSCGEVSARLGCSQAEDPCRVDADCANEPPVSCFSEPDQPSACKLGAGKWICTEPDKCGPCG